jgi:hypothetical protein
MRQYLLLALALGLAAGPARAAVTPDQIKKEIEKAYPVVVLHVEPTKVDGKSAYAVRVMKKSILENGGFGVTTLNVDPDTGKLIPAFRRGESGYTIPKPVAGEPHQVNVPRQGSTWR